LKLSEKFRGFENLHFQEKILGNFALMAPAGNAKTRGFFLRVLKAT
jgi:hypothetical protein